jgi:signal transduction histidine kinase
MLYSPSMKASRIRYALKLVLIFAIYLVIAKTSLNVYPGGHVVTVIWPPAGIALAVLLLFGYKVTPAISAAVFVLALTQGYSPLAALGFTIANTAEPMLGAFLLNFRNQFDHSFERVSDVVRFIVLAAVISTAFGATFGVIALLLSGAIHTAGITSSWVEWWVGDLLGDLVVVPFVMVWSYHGFRSLRNILSLFKATVLLGCLAVVTFIAFRGFNSIGIKPFVLAYLVFPLFIWISLRFRQLGSTTAIFITALIARFGTIATFRQAGAHVVTNRLVLLQTFLGATAATFMIISAGVLERDASYRRRFELATKAEQLSKQKARLQALNRAKDDFIMIASHQLKTPPTIIKQYTGMLLDDMGGKITAGQRSMLQHIYDANEKQLRVIRDILNVAQVDAGNVILHKETVDLVALLQEVIDDKTGMLAEHRQSLAFMHARDSYQVDADRIKLYTVLDNIVDNASKYTPDGKAIEVRLTKYNGHVTVAVKDEGIGFSKEDARRLFRKFTRISGASTTSTFGTGIGLYWAKKVMDLHGGSITTQSRPGRGSTFRISLPAVS